MTKLIVAFHTFPKNLFTHHKVPNWNITNRFLAQYKAMPFISKYRRNPVFSFYIWRYDLHWKFLSYNFGNSSVTTNEVVY